MPQTIALRMVTFTLCLSLLLLVGCSSRDVGPQVAYINGNHWFGCTVKNDFRSAFGAFAIGDTKKGAERVNHLRKTRKLRKFRDGEAVLLLKRHDAHALVQVSGTENKYWTLYEALSTTPIEPGPSPQPIATPVSPVAVVHRSPPTDESIDRSTSSHLPSDNQVIDQIGQEARVAFWELQRHRWNESRFFSSFQHQGWKNRVLALIEHAEAVDAKDVARALSDLIRVSNEYQHSGGANTPPVQQLLPGIREVLEVAVSGEGGPDTQARIDAQDYHRRRFSMWLSQNPQPQPPQPYFHTLHSADLKHRTEAGYVDFDGEKFKLVKPDGTEIWVDPGKLSNGSRALLDKDLQAVDAFEEAHLQWNINRLRCLDELELSDEPV